MDEWLAPIRCSTVLRRVMEGHDRALYFAISLQGELKRTRVERVQSPRPVSVGACMLAVAKKFGDQALEVREGGDRCMNRSSGRGSLCVRGAAIAHSIFSLGSSS